ASNRKGFVMCGSRSLIGHGFWAVGVCLLISARSVKSAEAPIDFNRHIRPLLAENCFACHGPDEKQRKAKLRLDVREAAVKNGVPIVPGKSGESELVRRITAADPEERMPPAKTGKRLTPSQIELLKKWINQGANYANHWAFITPKRPALPEVKNKSWPRNAIDYFVLARLQADGIEPSREADRATLIRRVTLDLT